MPPLC